MDEINQKDMVRVVYDLSKIPVRNIDGRWLEVWVNPDIDAENIEQFKKTWASGADTIGHGFINPGTAAAILRPALPSVNDGYRTLINSYPWARNSDIWIPDDYGKPRRRLYVSAPCYARRTYSYDSIHGGGSFTNCTMGKFLTAPR